MQPGFPNGKSDSDIRPLIVACLDGATVVFWLSPWLAEGTTVGGEINAISI